MKEEASWNLLADTHSMAKTGGKGAPQSAFRAPLSSRSDWEQAAHVFLAGPLSSYDPATATCRWTGLSSVYDPSTAGYEAWVRTLWFAAPLLASSPRGVRLEIPGGKSVELGAFYREAMVTGVGSRHSGPWWSAAQNLRDYFIQNMTLAFALLLAPQSLWMPLSERERSEVAVWLKAGFERIDVLQNNVAFFPLLIQLVCRQLDAAWDEDMTEDLFAFTEKMYLGEGWFADGFGRQFDCYVPWAMHFYSLVCAKLYADRRPELWEKASERARLFARDYAFAFDREGRFPPYGRSLIYRFCAASFWAACAWTGVEGMNHALGREITARCIASFLHERLLDPAGRMTVGFDYPNDRIAEDYSSHGSAYWAGKSFLFLALGEDHPAWKPAPPLPAEKGGFKRALAIPALELVGSPDGKNVTLYNHGSWHPFNWGDFPAKYGKFATSSAFGFNLSESNGEPGCDQMICLSVDGGLTWSHRRWMEFVGRDGEWWISRHYPFQAFPECVVTTAIAARGLWHVRLHRLQLSRATTVREGGAPLPTAERQPEEIFDENGVGVESPQGASGIWKLWGPALGKHSLVKVHVNVRHPRVMTPVVSAQFPPGLHWHAVAVYTSTEAFATARPKERPALSQVDETSWLLRWPDGSEMPVRWPPDVAAGNAAPPTVDIPPWRNRCRKDKIPPERLVPPPVQIL